jgi:hypothetical protein
VTVLGQHVYWFIEIELGLAERVNCGGVRMVAVNDVECVMEPMVPVTPTVYVPGVLELHEMVA